VDAALKRISDGTFGKCLDCEQEINTKRLEDLRGRRAPQGSVLMDRLRVVGLF
jgi:hypothetical protein